MNSGGKVARRSAADADGDKHDKEGERAEAGPVLKRGAEADAAIVQHGEQRRERESYEQVRKVNRASGHAIELQRIQLGKDVTCNASHRHGFPRADDEIGEHHHPAGGEADGRVKTPPRCRRSRPRRRAWPLPVCRRPSRWAAERHRRWRSPTARPWSHRARASRPSRPANPRPPSSPSLT